MINLNIACARQMWRFSIQLGQKWLHAFDMVIAFIRGQMYLFLSFFLFRRLHTRYVKSEYQTSSGFVFVVVAIFSIFFKIKLRAYLFVGENYFFPNHTDDSFTNRLCLRMCTVFIVRIEISGQMKIADIIAWASLI